MVTESTVESGSVDVDFNYLVYRYGGFAGGQSAFSQLCHEMVSTVHPDIKRVEGSVQAWNGGTYVGSMDESNDLRVWRCEYVIQGFESSHRKVVRDQYAAARRDCDAHGFRLRAWTLCIPVELDDDQKKWWKNWAKRIERTDGVVVEIWSELVLRRRLLAPEGELTRDKYFSPPPPAETAPTDAELGMRKLAELLDSKDDLEGTLFVRQMVEAGLVQTYEAREAFFNAEILTREIDDKGIIEEQNLLKTWRMTVQAIWATMFNDVCQRYPDRVPPGLYRQVMEAIGANQSTERQGLRATSIHGYGLMHQVVDGARAGWVRDWQRVAEDHRTSPPARESAKAAQ